MGSPDISKTRIEALHDWFCVNTGQKYRLDFARLLAWENWLLVGHNGKELSLVVRYLKRQISENRRNHGSLSLARILDLENFEKDLGLAQMASSGRLRTDRKLEPLPASEHEDGNAAQVRQAAKQIAADHREIAEPNPLDDAAMNELRNRRNAELEQLKRSL